MDSGATVLEFYLLCLCRLRVGLYLFSISEKKQPVEKLSVDRMKQELKVFLGINQRLDLAN